ncbi:MAG TPA: fluoride efflux transporter CrcB [Ferruginibacter sp.]|jgi:CrcB protein|nr:fluoride efflux transporter CrcB [Ferruginibacter sp.]
MIRNLLLVGLGGGLGSVLRYLTGIFIGSKFFPYATMAVNITGSFIIGIVLAMGMRESGWANEWKLFLATGLCGGFTTFSAFSLENMEMIQNGKLGLAAGYIILSVLSGIGAVYLGYSLMRE